MTTKLPITLLPRNGLWVHNRDAVLFPTYQEHQDSGIWPGSHLIFFLELSQHFPLLGNVFCRPWCSPLTPSFILHCKVSKTWGFFPFFFRASGKTVAGWLRLSHNTRNQVWKGASLLTAIPQARLRSPGSESRICDLAWGCCPDLVLPRRWERGHQGGV